MFCLNKYKNALRNVENTLENEAEEPWFGKGL